MARTKRTSAQAEESATKVATTNNQLYDESFEGEETSGEESEDEIDMEDEEEEVSGEESEDETDMEDEEEEVEQIKMPLIRPLLQEDEHFDCKISVRSRFKEVSRFIMGQLDKLNDNNVHLQQLRESPFGNLLDCSSHIDHSCQIIWAMLVRESNIERSSEMWFVVQGRPVRFSKKEYALITGLNCGKIEDEKAVKIQKKCEVFSKRHFPTSPPTMEDLEYTLAKLVGDQEHAVPRTKLNWDIIKVCLLLFVGGVLVPKDSRTQSIDREYLGLVDNVDIFYAYPWGTVSYEYLLKILKRKGSEKLKKRAKNIMDKTKKEGSIAYSGFVLPLTVLALECVPSLASEFASVRPNLDINLPRICRWEAKWTKNPPFSAVQKVVRASLPEGIKTVLVPTDHEKTLTFISNFDPLTDEHMNASLENMVKKLEQGSIFNKYPLDSSVQVRVPSPPPPPPPKDDVISMKAIMDQIELVKTDIVLVRDEMKQLRDEQKSQFEELVNLIGRALPHVQIHEETAVHEVLERVPDETTHQRKRQKCSSL